MTPARLRAPLAAAFCLAALALACLALSPRPPADPLLGVMRAFRQWILTTPFRSLFLLLATGGIVLLGTIVGMALHAYLKGRRVDGWGLLLRRLANTVLGYAFLSLLLLGIRSCQTGKPQAPPSSPPPTQAMQEGTGTPLPRSAVPDTPPETPLPAYVLVAVLLVMGGALLLLLRKKPTPGAQPPEPGEPELLARARRRLELGDQVRDAIIACYAEMCEVFLRGTPAGARTLTAREFSAFLRSRGVLEPEIQSLTSVFEKARYSLEPCEESDRERALQALRALEARYGAPQEAAP